MSRFFLSATVLCTLLGSPYLAQQKVDPKVEKLAPARESGPVAVVFGSKDDGLPEKLKVRGTISEVSFSRASCGVIYRSGTLKIKLLGKVEGYPHEEVFVVGICLINGRYEKKYLGKVVEMEVSKLYPEHKVCEKGKKPCYWGPIYNTLDSGGIPFYLSGWWEREIPVDPEP